MTKDFGWQMRSDILKHDAESKITEPARNHGWKVDIEKVEPLGEYILITMERNGFCRRVALLYTSGTDNAVYKRLETEADLTLFNGPPHMVDSFTQGLSRPVSSVGDFGLKLIQWNQESVPDKVVPEDVLVEQETVPSLPGPRIRRLRSETPIDAIWSRLSRLRSTTLARKAVCERAEAEGAELDAQAALSKGDGVAYAIRNASDYFALKDVGNVSQRILNLYYGCMSFAFAEMLASPTGPSELSVIENSTKQGHGLWTFDGIDAGCGGLAVGPTQSGFYRTWIDSMRTGSLLTLDRKPKRASDLETAPPGSWATMEQMFARIPEVGDLFEDIFTGSPAWVSPSYQPTANPSFGLFGSGERAKTSYVLLADDTGRMTAGDINALPGPIREIVQVPSGSRARHFQVAIDHPDSEFWFEVLDVHQSPFERSALILPLFGCVHQYRAICLAILYALSILVRYRPSLWRRVQEGDLDNMRALVEAFLATVERILPQQFLESVTGEKVSVHQPGSFLA